jgi:hypothetical protein
MFPRKGTQKSSEFNWSFLDTMTQRPWGTLGDPGTKWPWMFRHSTSKVDFCRMPDQPGHDAAPTFEGDGLPNQKGHFQGVTSQKKSGNTFIPGNN